MLIAVLGMNHKTADLRLREAFAKAAERRFGAANSAHGGFSYVLLSTCNRTEIYFSGENLAELHTYLLGVLRGDLDEEFEHRVYSYFGSDCFVHLARVTSGMDSALLGETEIQGQVKHAYESAAAYHTLASELHYLFQKSLKIGKDVRSTQPFGRGMPSVDEAILSAGFFLLGDLTKRSILFVGVSEINRRIFNSFKRKGLEKITFCNRSPHRVKELGVAQLAWEELERWIDFDLVVFGTKAPQYLVEKEELSEVFGGRRLVIDLSVPRNVDPRIARHPQVTLLNIDQLNRAVNRKRKLKLECIETDVIGSAALRQVELFRANQRARHVHGLLFRAG